MRRPGSYLHVRPGAFRAAAIILAVFVGVYALSTDAPVTAQVPVGMDALSVDTNTIGNTQGAIGSVEPCLGNVAPGSSIVIDVAAQGIPPYNNNGTPANPSDDSGGIIGYQFNLEYDRAAMAVTTVTIQSSAVNVLVANPGSTLFGAGDTISDNDGNYAATALDTGSGPPESGSGVLERIALTISASAAAGQYNLLIEPANVAHLDTTGAAYAPGVINAGAIAVGQPCTTISTPGPTPSGVTPAPVTPGPPTPAPTTPAPTTPAPTTPPTPIPPTPAPTSPRPATPVPTTPAPTAPPLPESEQVCSPVAPPPPPGPGPGGCGMDALRVDTDITGNTAATIGTVQPCIGDVSPGSTVTFDLTAHGVPAFNDYGTPADLADDSGGAIGYQFELRYDAAVMTVTAVTNNSNTVNLLVANTGSSLFGAGDAPPDADGNYAGGALDTGSATPESGSGVLERITVSISGAAASGQYNLLIDRANTAHLDTTGAAYIPHVVDAGAIAVGQPCGPLASPPPSTVTLTPTDDAYVAGEFPSLSYGHPSDLRSDASPLRESYLKFDLPSVDAGTLLSAKLRMFVANGSGGAQNVRDVLSGDWGESSLSWNSRPAKGSTVVTFTPGSATGVWIEVDVMAIVAPRTGAPVSLVIDTASSDAFHFNSAEAIANQPDLVLQYAASPIGTPFPAPTPTPNPSPVAGISFRGATTKVNSTASVSLAIARPEGTIAGDVLVASVATNGPGVWTAPPGWVQMAGVTAAVNPKLFAYYRVASAGEPSSYTWWLNSSAMSSGGIARYSGVDNANPLDATSSTASSSAVVPALTVPGITTASPGAMLVGGAAINSSITTVLITAPAGMTERWDLGGKRHEYDDSIQSTAGPSGTRTWTFSSARAAAAWLAALRPAP